MSDTKHTPGPWSANMVGYAVASGHGRAVNARLCPSPEELDANFRLMAAAPDMLEALRAVISVADRKTVEFDKAHAAIAKATGQ